MVIEKLSNLKSWRRYGLAMLLGICAAAALPPFFILPLAVPAFSGLFLLNRSSVSGRQAFWGGWWWGLGHFTAGLYWICISLWVEPKTFAWLTPVVLFGLPAVLGIYIGLVTWVLYFFRLRFRLSAETQLMVFALLWVAVEYIRTYLFTGFPWNLIGYIWTASEITLQSAAIIGIYGLSWITVFISSVPALWLEQQKPAAANRLVYCAVALFGVMILFGIWRLDSHPTRYTQTKVRMVQANIEQNLKWDPHEARKDLRKYMDMTDSKDLEGVNLVLWPETAVPFYIMSKSAITQAMGSILPTGAILITGGLRGNGFIKSDASNSLFVIDGQGIVRDQYDKHHLVPFGEYIPFRWMPGVEMVTEGMGDFIPGKGPRSLHIEPYPSFSPLICYEAIFPAAATDGKGEARWLFSLTDDAWFGNSAGLFQDMQMARTRAVEQGLPMMRAANTGISAAFDGFGRMLGSLPIDKEGVLDVYLPEDEQSQAIAGRYPMVGFLFILAANVFFLLLYSRNLRANL